jgi:hypothetical protein
VAPLGGRGSTAFRRIAGPPNMKHPDVWCDTTRLRV